MKKVWKWVIGIVVVLVVVAALVAGAFMFCSHFANVVSFRYLNRPGMHVPGDGRFPFDYKGEGQGGWSRRYPGMMPFGGGVWGWRGMHMRGPGLMGFGWMMPLGGLVGGLFSLGFLALVVLGIVWLVRRLRTPAAVATQVAPVPPVAEVAPIAAAIHPCSRCGEPVQEGWKHCPNCGKRQ